MRKYFFFNVQVKNVTYRFCSIVYYYSHESFIKVNSELTGFIYHDKFFFSSDNLQFEVFVFILGFQLYSQNVIKVISNFTVIIVP